MRTGQSPSTLNLKSSQVGFEPNGKEGDDDDDEDHPIQVSNSEDLCRDYLDEVLVHLGVFGLYQKLLFLAMMPFGFFFAFVYFAQMFVTATPHNHWCRVPELKHLDLETRRKLAAPPNEHCRMYSTDWSAVLQTLKPPPPDTPTVPCQHGWEFQMTDIPYATVTTEREWVCNRGSYAPFAQSLFFGGSLVGGLLFGWTADKYGRVPALVGANLVGCIGGLLTVISTELWDFTLFRFLVGMANDNCFAMIYILVLEYVGVEYRTYVATYSLGLSFGPGCMLVPQIALWIGDWRKFLLWTSLPMLSFLIAPLIVPESARWLASKGHGDRAVKMLHRFERINKSKVPQELMDEFIFSARESGQGNKSVRMFIRNSTLRLMLGLLVTVYMCVAVVYDGIIRMSDNLGLDFFLTFTVSSSTEILAIVILIFCLERFGRRYLACAMMVFTAALLLIAMFVPKGIPQVSLAVLARFLATVAGNTLFQWGAELLPTGVRASGSAFVHVSGFFATSLSPFIVYSGHLWENLPLLVLCILSVVSVLVAAMLPETMGRALPQTFADGERLVRKYSLIGKLISARKNKRPKVNKPREEERVRFKEPEKDSDSEVETTDAPEQSKSNT